MAFHVGQLVACIAEFAVGFSGEAVPHVGGVYTVREVVTFASGAGLRLEEIINPIVKTRNGHLERSYPIGGFRPLTESRLAIFRRLLAPTPKEHEPA